VKGVFVAKIAVDLLQTGTTLFLIASHQLHIVNRAKVETVSYPTPFWPVATAHLPLPLLGKNTEGTRDRLTTLKLKSGVPCKAPDRLVDMLEQLTVH